jgi:hypothetical protein
MVPPGYGWWGVAPYHWLWWAGMPSPYPYGGPMHHASVLGTVMAMLLLLGFAGIAVIGIAWLVRRQRRTPTPVGEPEVMRGMSEMR